MSINPRKAFTLIELLVVIAIIALLLSVIMPALSAAKRQATGAVCLSNENQLSKSWHLFASDNNDTIVDAQPEYDVPADGVTDYGVPYGKAKNFTSMPINAANNARDWSLESRIRGFEKGGLWPYFENYKLFHCPADKRSTKDEIRYGYRTYSIGGVYSRMALKSLVGTSTWEGNVAVTKTTQIVNPSARIVWLEEMDVEQQCNNNTWNIFLNAPKRWWDPVAVWHGDSSTFGFADGHAERHKWENQLTIDKGDFAKASAAAGSQKVVPVPAGEEEDWDWLVSHYMPARVPGSLRAVMPR